MRRECSAKKVIESDTITHDDVDTEGLFSGGLGNLHRLMQKKTYFA